MIMKYDFDKHVCRCGTGCVKYDGMEPLFGTNELTPLWVADMDFEVAPCISEALQRRFAHTVYGYGCTSGSFKDSIQRWLERRHGVCPGAEELAFVPGVVRGIAYAINFFTRPGDKILIQPPVYHPFRNLTVDNRRLVVENPLVEREGTFDMDLDGFEATVERERPKMMILCNPHNPIGRQWDLHALQRVASVARKYDMIVVSDEIHGDLMLYGNRHIPFAWVSDDAAAVSVTFGAPSKTFNIAGLAASWMIVRNPELRQPFYKWMSANEFSEPGFTAALATEAAYDGGEAWLDQLLPYLEGNIEAVERWFGAEMPCVRPVRPQASFLVWLDCRELALPAPQLAGKLIDAGLALNDGSMFGVEGEGFMRMNIGMPRAGLLAALPAFKSLL